MADNVEVDRARVSIIIPFKVTTTKQVDWLLDALHSVEAQTYKDWEVVLCNDGSTADLALLKLYLKTMSKGKVFSRVATREGVAHARNQAAKAAHGELLLPLDADDELLPDSLERMVKTWDLEGHKHGIVYGDVELFGQDWSSIQPGETYDFKELLRRVYMLVGCLHRKSDWEKVGGWKVAMEDGLEDWEYWIALGEIGVCGYYVPATLYRYRKHTEGRLAWLKADKERFEKAMQTLRDLHRESYAGRFPMACCGKSSTAPTTFARTASAAGSASLVASDRVSIIYQGGRTGSFFVTGRITGTRYKVPGQNQQLITMDMIAGVFGADVEFILSLGAGKDFVRGS
jgi:glycosyltransferase involved in cell wall biosynthesis